MRRKIEQLLKAKIQLQQSHFNLTVTYKSIQLRTEARKTKMKIGVETWVAMMADKNLKLPQSLNKLITRQVDQANQ